MSAELNESQNATVGMTVGVIEVLILQPFNYAKNMTQQRQPISFSPAVWYRGVAANCVNMGSCTMIQFAVGGKFKNLVLQGDTKRRLQVHEEMLCGAGAGFVSAMVGSPLELIMVQQQRKGGSVATTIRNIVSNSPLTVTRGFTGAAIRESLWTCGYLSIPPIVRHYLMETYPSVFDSNEKARIPAALLGGLFACYLSHPVDTIKTCMQGDVERVTYGTFTQTARKIWSDSGFFGFYRGATFRYGRMVCAVFIMDAMKDFMSKLMYPSAFE